MREVYGDRVLRTKACLLSRNEFCFLERRFFPLSILIHDALGTYWFTRLSLGLEELVTGRVRSVETSRWMGVSGESLHVSEHCTTMK